MASSLPKLPQRVTRRAVLAAPALLAAAPGGDLHITAYDGFVPAALQQQFQADTGTAIRVRLAASQAPELGLLVSERDHPLTDICTVAGSRLHQFVEAGIIEPLDTARLRNWHRIAPLYAGADWLRVGGSTMALPLVIGANVMVFDTEQVTPVPDSWNALFDPRYRGRITYDIEDCLLCTMLLQGADPTFVSYVDRPAAAAAAVGAARDMLVRNKPQVLRFFDEGSELQQMLLGGDVVLAQTYASTPARLILAGKPFRRVVPREGSLSFVYGLAIVKGAANRDAAYRFLDSLLGTPQIGAVLTRSAGYMSCMADAADGLTALERAAYGLDPAALDRLRFPRFEGQALSSALIDRAVEEVRAG